MNFVKLYIGDYLRDTGTLTLAQHGAYALMLFEFYATEKPLPAGRELHRLLRADSKAERDAIDFVAAKFWQQTDAGLSNPRGVKEIERAAHQRAVNQEIGKRGGRPKGSERRTESETESVSETEANRNPNQTPDTRQIPSVPNGTGAAAPPPSDRDMVFANGVTLLTAAGITDKNARSFLAAQCKAHGESSVRKALERCAAESPIQPIPWLQAVLQAGPKASKHSGFASKDYRNGVEADGTFTA